MIENDQHIQDWQQENKDALLGFVQSVMTSVEYIDICAVGSRVYWHNYADSDFDIAVFVPDEAERTPNTFHEYDGIRMAISYQPLANRDGLVMDLYKMPQYSLMTGTMYEGNTEHYVPCRLRYGKSVE